MRSFEYQWSLNKVCQWSSLRRNRIEEGVIEPKPCGIAEQEFPILVLERGMTDEIGSAWCDVGTIGSIGRRIAGRI